MSVLASFPGVGINGGTAVNGVLLGGDGNFYGTTEYTGTGDAGMFFKVTAAGVLTTPHLVTPGGKYCVAALAEFPNGTFYGVTQSGGATNGGTIFGRDTRWHDCDRPQLPGRDRATHSRYQSGAKFGRNLCRHL